MDSTTWNRAKQVFHEALEKSGPQRKGFVALACGEDRDLLARVEALLAAHDEAGEFLVSPTVPEAGDAARAATALEAMPPAERPGAVIGNYKLLSVIGEGGFGVVYMAEQEQPVRRRVALKIIKPGMDTGQVIARFEAERQALALMEHPNIAKVFDAGATDTGRPYFAMELVQGVPITEYCDDNRLSTQQRLHLFAEVCGAVLHAHQKGIIHRDIKPSNVLVGLRDGQPVPTVIDFGVAKATDRPLTERSLFTEHGQFIGTPLYMSPEQAELSGRDVDTRSDIYSLGVLLYELLVGAPPFDPEELRAAGIDEIRRRIRDDEPSKPSTRLTTLAGESSTESARRRRVDLSTLRRQLSGDLDWITMKALEKDPSRRYGSSGELAADIERHLTHLPVLAGPPSAAYRASKFVRRHRLAVVLASAGVLVLAAFAVSMAVQAGRIAHERDRANAEANRATRISEFLIDLFEVSDPLESRGKTITALEVLDEGAKQIDRGLTEQPATRADLMETMGEVYVNLALFDQAEPLLEQSLEIRRRVLGDDHPDTLRSIHALGGVRSIRNPSEGDLLYREALEGRRRVLGDDHPDTLESIFTEAADLAWKGQAEEAERLHREALEGRRRVLGDDHPDTIESMMALGTFLTYSERLDEAELFHQEALERSRRVHGADHPSTLDSMIRMGFLLQRQGKVDEAEVIYRKALRDLRRVFGDDHHATLRAIGSLAFLFKEHGQPEKAEPLYRQGLEGYRRVAGNDHPATLIVIDGLGLVLKDLGRLDEAEEYAREALERHRGTLGYDHLHTLMAVKNMGLLLEAQGKPDEAERLYREALAKLRPTQPESDSSVAAVLLMLGRNLNAQRRYTEAETGLRECLEIRRGLPAVDRWSIPITQSLLGQAIAAQGRFEEAEPLLLDGYAEMEPPARLMTRKREALERIVGLYEAWGKPNRLAEWRSELEAVDSGPR